jgi:vacuolar-type H+-ATPase subunit F/Vma7
MRREVLVMTDLAIGVQQAVFDALTAGVTLAPVLTHLDENFAYPFVLIGEDIVTDLSDKLDRFERHEVSISVCIQGASKKPLRAIQEQVRTALVGASITAAGCSLSKPQQQTMNDVLLDDGATYVGTQHFLIFAQ